LCDMFNDSNILRDQWPWRRYALYCVVVLYWELHAVH